MTRGRWQRVSRARPSSAAGRRASENEQDDWNRADEILGADWIDPGYARFKRAWEEHPQRELLDEHKRDVDENGMPKWHAVRELHEDGWVEYWQRPLDPTDTRAAICVGKWPEKVETDALKDAQAIVDEHDPSSGDRG